MTGQRLDVQEAAEVLGTTVDAVRKRIQRGTLESERKDGRVYVWLDTDQDTGGTGESNTLISAKDETIRVLQEQLKAEREANRENRRIIAGLTQRIPAIEAPTESPGTGEESRQEAGEYLDGEETQDANNEARNGTQSPKEEVSRPWWRRLFS